MKNGFTLIELLVVVLIIGILAAVALPQYAKIVERSIAAEGLSLLSSLRNSAYRFYLENGRYPEAADWNSFDISLPDSKIQGENLVTKNWYFRLESARILAYRRLPGGTMTAMYYIAMYYDRTKRDNCLVFSSSPSAIAACKYLCKSDNFISSTEQRCYLES